MDHSRRKLHAGIPLFAVGMPELGVAQATKIDEDAILNDPDAPVGGDLHGDVTIVSFFDYNCSYCKTSAAELARIVADDGEIRLVYKDWLVIAETV